MPDDGMGLLTSNRVEPLLRAAVEHQGGHLLSWSLDHVDAAPEHSTTATYLAQIRWPHGDRSELLGVSARSGELSATDARAEIFDDGNRQVAVWLYPDDPDLPGLATAAYPERMAEVLNAGGVLPRPVTSGQLSLSMIGYRPRRRAVVKVVVNDPHEVFYVKVLRERIFAEVYRRHAMLRQAGIPAPEVALSTPDQLLVTRELPGRRWPVRCSSRGSPARQMTSSASWTRCRPPWRTLDDGRPGRTPSDTTPRWLPPRCPRLSRS